MTIQEKLTVHQKYRFSVDDFLLLARSGAFEPYARTELIEGEILAVNAIQSRHAETQAALHLALGLALRAIGSDLKTYIAPSIKLGGDSMPEPDIVLAGPHTEAFLPLSHVRLVIEISDTTLVYDIGRKAALYARTGVPEYWVVDVENRVIHQMSSPSGDAYTDDQKVTFGDRILAATIGTLAVETDAL